MHHHDLIAPRRRLVRPNPAARLLVALVAACVSATLLGVVLGLFEVAGTDARTARSGDSACAGLAGMHVSAAPPAPVQPFGPPCRCT